MVLKYHISPTSLLEDMIVKIYESGSESPGQEVFTQNIPQAGGGGHPNPTTITAVNLDMVVHRVMLISAISANVLHDYTAEPRVDGVTVFDPIRFKIGDGNLYTPNVGENFYSNPLLLNLQENEYTVHRNNYGYLWHNEHINVDPSSAGFALLGTDEFNSDEEFIIQRKSTVTSTLLNSSVVGKWFGGFYDIVANTDYNNTDHLRKLLRFHGSVEFTFTAISSVPIGYLFIFQNFGVGALNSVSKVNFLNAPLLWNGATKSSIDVPLFSEAAVVFDGSNWNVVYLIDSKWQTTAVIPAGTFLGDGTLNLGNIPAGNHVYEVIHNLNITGDYNVMICLKGTEATWVQDNNVTLVWWHHPTEKSNKFKLSVEEWAPGVQNLSVYYRIYKA